MTNNKALFIKWIQHLFYIQCIALVVTLIAKLPFVGSWFSWVIRIISIITILILYKLSPLNERYRKTVIFMVVSVVTAIVARGLGMFVIVGAICSIIATFQEYTGHSEMMAGVDEKLSKNWHSLFNWNFWGGFAVSFIAAICATIMGVVASGEVDFAVGVTQTITQGYGIILNIVYLVLLKRTFDKYEMHEPKVEEVGTDEI